MAANHHLRMSRMGTVAAALTFVWVIDLILWADSGAVECWPSCTTYQDVVAYGLWLLPLAFVCGVVAMVLSARRSRR